MFCSKDRVNIVCSLEVGKRGASTVGPLVVLRPAAVASTPMIKAISWTSAFVSRAFAVLARSWESLPWRHGCVETWTLEGSD